MARLNCWKSPAFDLRAAESRKASSTLITPLLMSIYSKTFHSNGWYSVSSGFVIVRSESVAETEKKIPVLKVLLSLPITAAALLKWHSFPNMGKEWDFPASITSFPSDGRCEDSSDGRSDEPGLLKHAIKDTHDKAEMRRVLLSLVGDSPLPRATRQSG
ncbi:hypothetical protein CDAR_218481 [Caerostris darwini]|uniref:Uncharacterized protein n=1 Tax=Caerostris darwini TaxID=1538125 RepID=A0AAV4RG82_9ARAC|nr:hypothetical protein CDAR_218481 [Caerostris darwini]